MEIDLGSCYEQNCLVFFFVCGSPQEDTIRRSNPKHLGTANHRCQSRSYPGPASAGKQANHVDWPGRAVTLYGNVWKFTLRAKSPGGLRSVTGRRLVWWCSSLQGGLFGAPVGGKAGWKKTLTGRKEYKEDGAEQGVWNVCWKSNWEVKVLLVATNQSGVSLSWDWGMMDPRFRSQALNAEIEEAHHQCAFWKSYTDTVGIL